MYASTRPQIFCHRFGLFRHATTAPLRLEKVLTFLHALRWARSGAIRATEDARCGCKAEVAELSYALAPANC